MSPGPRTKRKFQNAQGISGAKVDRSCRQLGGSRSDHHKGDVSWEKSAFGLSRLCRSLPSRLCQQARARSWDTRTGSRFARRPAMGQANNINRITVFERVWSNEFTGIVFNCSV